MRFVVWACGLMFSLFPIVPNALQGQGDDPPGVAWSFAEARQFDFWIGEWSITNRFFRDGQGWVEDGRSVAKIYSILDGKAILEYWNGDQVGGRDIRGFSLRYFDRDKDRWVLALNWPGQDSPSFGQLEGRFRHGRGEFRAEGTDANGNSSITRYSFSDIGPDSFRWDDGVSTDGGRTWRGSWIMEFSRTAPEAEWPALGDPFHTFHGRTRCTQEGARQLDSSLGRWQGMLTAEDGSTTPVTLEGREVLDGCAIMQLAWFGEGPEALEVFQLASYFPRFDGWAVLQLDDQAGTGYRYQTGGETDGDWIVTDTPFNGFQPGAAGEPLFRTAWRERASDRLVIELLESTDAGESWVRTGTVELTRAGG